MRPSILVLDEPTAGLDPVSEAHMIEMLLRLNRQENITLILSTHCVDLLPGAGHAHLRAAAGAGAAGRTAGGQSWPTPRPPPRPASACP